NGVFGKHIWKRADGDACAFSALEISSRQSDPNNWKSLQTAKKCSMAMIGASDAHTAGEVGNAYTVFENRIRDIHDLVRELMGGRFEPKFHDDSRDKWLQSALHYEGMRVPL
ncbi:PHP-associated domain-containing protein, partial [Thermodesulfobacteriota bacterium]